MVRINYSYFVDLSSWTDDVMPCCHGHHFGLGYMSQVNLQVLFIEKPVNKVNAGQQKFIKLSTYLDAAE
jgi:hypothetical protein